MDDISLNINLRHRITDGGSIERGRARVRRIGLADNPTSQELLSFEGRSIDEALAPRPRREDRRYVNQGLTITAYKTNNR